MTSFMDAEALPLDLLLAGFDGRPLPASKAALWRIGRWLRTQGARRPMSLRVVNDGTAIVDGRILAIDDVGGIQDLSTTRRVSRSSSITCPTTWKSR